MQFSGGFSQRLLAWTVVCLCLGREALSARSSLRAHLVHSHDHAHNNDHDLYHDHSNAQYHMAHHVTQHIANHVQGHDNMQQHLEYQDHSGSIAAEDAEIRKEIDKLLNGKPTKHLMKLLMQQASKMNPEEIVDKLGEKIPASIASLVKATTSSQHTRGNQEFSEESLAKARRILNGMVEDAQTRLDLKTIECHNFRDRNRANFEQVAADQARLGTQLIELGGLIQDANAGIKDMSDKLEAVDEKLAEAQKAYDDMKREDDAEMLKRRDDLAVAEFILKFTVCKDKPWPTSFFEEGEDGPNFLPQKEIGVLKCDREEGDLEFYFEDPKLQAQAQKFLTPGARLKLQKYLADVHSLPALMQNPTEEDDEPGTQHSESARASTTTKETTTTVTVSSTTAATSTTPVISLVRKSFAAQPEKGGPPLPPKCVLGKPNCGLLHDNMSLMWGKFKDSVDELQVKIDNDLKNWKNLQADYNQQKELYTGQSGAMDQQLAEATSKQATDRSESTEKATEHRLLEKEFKEKWGECQATMYEILHTDICGVLTVRGEVSKYSKKVPPTDIVDCEVSDFREGECMLNGKPLPCDDQCDPHGGTPDCGGTKLLTRDILTTNNEHGVKCPVLMYNRKCNQMKCPIDCAMDEWSGWGACTADCAGGTQLRTRNLKRKPKNGGTPCDSPQESMSCNTGSCNRDCKLKKWSSWSACTAACGGGLQQKYRGIKVPTRGEGKCYKHHSHHRLAWQDCNSQPCQGDEQCVAKMDVIIAIDASGSMREKGFEILRAFAVALVKRFEGEFAGNKAVQVGALLFGNGMVQPDGIVSPAIAITKKLSFNAKEVAEEIDKVKWEKGFTNMAQAFTKADEMFFSGGGRKTAHSNMIVITDGMPSFIFSLKQEVSRIKSKGTNIVMVETNGNLHNTEESLMRSLASSPPEANYIHVPGLTTLDREMGKWVQKVLVQSCPKAISFSKMESDAETNGFELIREKFWCGEEKEKNVAPHKFLGTVETPAECMKTVMEQENPSNYFAFGTEAMYNKGNCYMEDTKDAECPEGFKKAPTNFYKILPVVPLGGES